MKKLIISIILSSFFCLAFSQDLKVLDLSKGGVHIADISVVKIKANQFVVICDSSLAISQVILNAGKSDSMKVKDTAVPDILYKEKTTNYTNLQFSKDNKDTLKIFVLENSHNYQIEHNGKTWNIIVRKMKIKPTDLFFDGSNLHIGDSCIGIRDTMRIALNDSLVLSKWDRQLFLFKNGLQLKDSLCIDVDDSCCYYFKSILSGDSIIHVNDTLSIKFSNNQFCIVVFEENDFHQSNYWWLLLLLLIIPAYYIIKKRKIIYEHFPWLKNSQSCNQVTKVDVKQECLRQLNNLLDKLLKNLPNKINGFEKKKLFIQKDNIESILKDLTIVEATNKQSLINKCDEIRQFINENQTALRENPSPAQDTKEASEKNEAPITTFESGWFVDILSTIESLKFEGDDTKEEGLSHSTIEHIKTDLALLSERIQNELRIAKEQENEEVSRSWQIRYDNLSDSYKELQDSYNKDIKAAAYEAKCKAEEALSETMKELEKRAIDAEENAQKIEKSKKEAIAEAVRKEQESHDKEAKRLKESKEKAEEQAKLAEQSKKKAIEDAVRKEKEYHLKEEKRLKEGKEKSESELRRSTLSLEATQKELRSTKIDRDNKIIKIQQLEKAQEQFTHSLASVPFAEIYSKQVHELLKLGSQIQTAAYTLLDSNVEDPYFIMKAISKYGKMIDGIDMESFLTDINMVSKANFVFKDSSLATFKEDNKDIDSIVRSYFFNQYLEKYINAIMVLNESMSGLKLLLPEVMSQVILFDKYRDEILLLAKKLKVSVLFVKVGDMAGENIDLKAKTVDVEIGKPGQILEIENCIVYPIDNRKPQTKIKVTIKK